MGKYNTNRVTVNANAFSDAVQAQMDLYLKELEEDIPGIVEDTANHCIQAIKAYAAVVGIPDTKYIKGWTKKKAKGSNSFATYYTVYNPKHYRVAHLLEHGHTIISHGKVRGTAKAYPHLAPAEQNAIQYLENKLKKRASEK